MSILTVPVGSQIQTDYSPEGLKIQWENPDNPLYRFGMALFLLCWLGGWFSGETSTALKLWSDFQQGKSLEMFLVFWLCGWTVGGVFAVTFLITLIKGGGPAQLILGPYDLQYKPGATPMSNLFQRNRQQMTNPFKLLTGGKAITVRRQEISNLQIGYAGSDLRVTFDVGAQRIEVGQYLTEPEKEWLQKTMREWLGGR